MLYIVGNSPKMSLIHHKYFHNNKSYKFTIYIDPNELVWFKLGEFIPLYGIKTYDQRDEIIARQDIKAWKDFDVGSRYKDEIWENTLFANEYGIYALLNASDEPDIDLAKIFFIGQVMSNVRSFCHGTHVSQTNVLSREMIELEKKYQSLNEELNLLKRISKLKKEYLTKAISDLSKNFELCDILDTN